MHGVSDQTIPIQNSREFQRLHKQYPPQGKEKVSLCKYYVLLNYGRERLLLFFIFLWSLFVTKDYIIFPLYIF